jgi:hypothetical protein
MSKFGAFLALFLALPFFSWGQIRTQGFLRLKADQARIEAALEAALRTGRVTANADTLAGLFYAQTERPLRAVDSAEVARVQARGYYLDRTNVKTYCLFLLQQEAFYLVRYAVGGLGIISVRPANVVYTPTPALTRGQVYQRDRSSRQNRQRDRAQAEHLRYFLLEEGRLQL